MTALDRLGEIQANFKKKPGTVNAALNKDGRVPFGPTLDVAQNLPRNPQSFNDQIEDWRQSTTKAVGENLGTGKALGVSAAITPVLPVVGVPLLTINAAAMGLTALDKKTDGKTSKILMAGAKNVRSNYAFVADVAKHDAAMGFLATLTMVAGGTVGAIGGFAVAGPAGAFAGAALGVALAGKAERDVAESGTFGKSLEMSAKLSESAAGQETYNFGRDSVHLASKITGWQTLGDTSKGIGAVTSGLINFGFESAVAPDIKATSLAGKVVRESLVGGITPPLAGVVAKKTAQSSFGVARTAKRLAEDVDLLKKTAAGEKTSYTPVFEFYRNNDAATILERPEFRNNEYGQIGANLVAGKSDEVISLVLRIGRGDKAAIDEIAVKHPSTFAEILRYEGILDTVAQTGTGRISYGFTRANKENIVLSKKLPDNTAIIEAEIGDLRGQYSWLDKSLKLDSAMQERTVSVFPGVEKLRNDMALQRANNKLSNAAEDITTRETRAGNIVQKIYQKSPLSVPIRWIERNTDDAPHATVNFNDAIQSATRVRTTMRATIDNKVLPGVEAKALYDEFIGAKTEGAKLATVEKINSRVIEQVANKHGVPASIKDLVLNEYINLTKKNKAKAQAAQAENKAYMIDDAGEVVADPQLISQLANGSYLVDVVMFDKAFARYAKRMGEEASLPVNAAMMGKVVLDEFNSIWRYFTLARTGFPINVMRDSTLRTWGDGAMFYSLKALGEQSMEAIVNKSSRVSEMRRFGEGILDPKKNIRKIRTQIELHENSLGAAKQALKNEKYDPLKPPKEMSPELTRLLDYTNKIEKTIAELRRQENAVIQGIESKRVGRDKITVEGYDFPAAFSGRFGDISFQKLRGKDDIRGLLASVKELEVASVRRDRNGGHAIRAEENEQLHIKSWDNVLNNILRNDPVSREIMSRNVKGLSPAQVEKELVDWIRSPKSGDIVERFGYDAKLGRNLTYSDAKVIYQRALAALNQFAPDIKLQKLVMEDKANILELKKMYPDLTTRPDVISDLALDLLGQSTLTRRFATATKDVVTWMATVPTSRLSYNPYFQAKYEHKLQNMVAVANAQGRKLSEFDKGHFESVARNHALNEYRSKINSFNRDMNYPAWINYVMAFFPAVVEQYRAYGKLTMEHPEFPMKIMAMSTIPSQIGNVKVDEFGTEYTEVTLPVLGINARLPVSWFDAVNPTGGHILSAGPVVTATVNEVAKRTNLENKFTRAILPFGTQSNSLGALTPNTIRRAGQGFQAFFLKSGDQYNKDMNMFIELKRKEFTDANHRQPSPKELAGMYTEASNDSISLSIVRALGAGILPSQPRYVSPLQQYADLLSKYNKEYGVDGNERFVNDYPEYFMLVDKLTDSTSGIRADETAVNLVRKNGKVIEEMVASIGKDNLSVLGAVFNDDDYNFSSLANSYLASNSVPGTRTKFKESGDALENSRSSIVTKGWRDWNKMIEVVTQNLKDNNYTVAKGYGKAVLDKYKASFVKQAKIDNPLWYDEKAGAGFTNKRNATIRALTIAANSDDMWKDLAKQPRWHTIVEYLNFRYDVYDELKARGKTLASAQDIEEKANAMVAHLRSKDINFGKFYDRYFEGDTFDYVPD